MTVEQFQKKIIKANWYDKYLYSLLFLAVFIGGLYFLYDVIAHQAKYDKLGTRYWGYFGFLFLTLLGLSGLFFVPNRYKVLTIVSTLPSENKRKVLDSLKNEFGNAFFDEEDDLYSFTYSKNWWTSKYKIYLSFDQHNFYASVQSITRGYLGSGIIDLGGTEKIRQRLIACLTNLLTVTNSNK
jgi:hypothetical protein